MNENFQSLANELHDHTQRTTRTLLETQLEVDAICNSLNMMLEAIEQGTYEGKHDQASVSEMIKIATGIRDQVATFFDDLFVLNRDLAAGIALERFENIEEVLKNSARFSERINWYIQDIESLRLRLSGGNDSSDDDVTVDASTFPPIPDLSKFDFSYRPKLKPVLKKDVDEDDPFSRYHMVAWYEMPATIFRDSCYVYCDVKRGKEPGKFTYFIANEYYEQNEGDDLPNGDYMESRDQEFTMRELILYLEEYNLGKWPKASVSQHLYECLEGYESLPIAKMPDMDVGSNMYPQLKEFYEVLFAYLHEWVNQHSEMPSVEEFLEVADHFTDYI